jgi:hypothetical protein
VVVEVARRNKEESRIWNRELIKKLLEYFREFFYHSRIFLEGFSNSGRTAETAERPLSHFKKHLPAFGGERPLLLEPIMRK